MPNRIIKESALDSEDLDKLSNGAERLFWRLIVVADDFGRFEGSPQVVKARCFPRKVDTLRTSEVQTWMNELTPSLVRYYHVNGRQYGFFVNWLRHQQKRANKSKFPDPTESEVIRDDSNCNQLQSNVSEIEIENVIENRESRTRSGRAASPTLVYSLDFQRAWEINGLGSKAKAWEAWRKAGAHLVTDVRDEILNGLRREAEWREKAEKYRATDPRFFIPSWKHLVTWINQRCWDQGLSEIPSGADDEADAQVKRVLARIEAENAQR